MEIPFRGNDFGLIGRHTLDLIGPFTRCLKRCLDSFRAAVHWQRGVEAGESASLGKKRS